MQVLRTKGQEQGHLKHPQFLHIVQFIDRNELKLLSLLTEIDEKQMNINSSKSMEIVCASVYTCSYFDTLL